MPFERIGIAVVTAVASLLIASAVGGRPVAAQELAQPHGFIQGRYGARSTLGIQTGVKLGSLFVMTGVFQNPRTGYHATVAGLGGRLATQHASVFLAAAAKYESHGWFAQLYVAPEARLGSVLLTANTVANAPLGSEGAWQLNVDRSMAALSLGRHVAVGAGYSMSLTRGDDITQALGPAARLTLHPAAALDLMAVRDFASDDVDVRGVMRLSF